MNRNIVVGVATVVVFAGAVAFAVLQPPWLESVGLTGADRVEAAAQQVDPTVQKAGREPASAELTRREFGDWVLLCPEGGPPDRCALAQQHVSTANNQVLLSINVRPALDGTFEARMWTPLGVALRPGIELSLDTQPVGRVPFSECGPQMCEAAGIFAGNLIDKMRSGTDLTASFQMFSGQSITLEISAEGLVEALPSLQAAVNDGDRIRR